MTHHRWVDLPDFPGYVIDRRGNIMNKKTERLVTPSINQGGNVYIRLMRDGIQRSRGVAQLVCNTFIDKTDIPEHFNTPTHLDNDRTNNSVKNLVLRPRWFAVTYLQEIPYWMYMHDDPMPVYDIHGNKYKNMLGACMELGILPTDMALAAFSEEPLLQDRPVCFPFQQHFFSEFVAHKLELDIK